MNKKEIKKKKQEIPKVWLHIPRGVDSWWWEKRMMKVEWQKLETREIMQENEWSSRVAIAIAIKIQSVSSSINISLCAVVESSLFHDSFNRQDHRPLLLCCKR
jgi:hypothetical protein